MGDQSLLFLEAIQTNCYSVTDFKILQKHLYLDLFMPNPKYSKAFYIRIKKLFESLDSLEANSDYVESKKYFQSKKDMILTQIDLYLSKQVKSTS